MHELNTVNYKTWLHVFMQTYSRPVVILLEVEIQKETSALLDIPNIFLKCFTPVRTPGGLSRDYVLRIPNVS